MSGRKAAGTSKAFAIDVDDWDDAKPGSSSQPTKKNASQPPAQRTADVDLVTSGSDDDDIVMQGRRWVNKSANDVVYKGKNWKGKVPPSNLKAINGKKKKKQSRATTTHAGSDKRRAQEDSDYEETPRKRPTRAKAKAKTKTKQPETYTVSSDSSSGHDEPPPIVKPPKRPAGSTSTATSHSSNALITSYFDKEKHADNGPTLPKRGDRPPPTKRLRLSRPSGTPAPAPSSSRSATAVSPTTNKRIPSPEVVIATHFPAAAVRDWNVAGSLPSTSAPRPSPSPRKTTEIPSQASSSTPQLTAAASIPKEIINGVKPPHAAVPLTTAPKPIVGSSKDMPMQISDSEPEPERTPSPELPALNEEWIYDLEATDPAPPPALSRWRSESASIAERSPSPQIGPLQDECIYSLEGLHIRAEREDTPDASDSEQRHDVDMALDQRCPPTRGAASGARLRRVHTGLGLLHARLMEQDASLYASARIDAVKRLRAVGKFGPSLRTTAHNRKGVPYDFPPRTAHAFAASGAVNDVVQKNGWIAAGCSTSCIVHDDVVAATDREPLPGPDNNQHTLAVFSPSRNRWDGYDAHSRPVVLPPSLERQYVVASARHYTVEGVAWDPMHPSRLVSCGADGMVAMWQPTANGHMGIARRWDLKSRCDERRVDTKYEYDSASPDVTFSPHDPPLFAVGPSKTGQIYLHYGPLDGDGHFIISGLRRNRAPWGPLQWGHAASHRVLFAGVSGAYNMETGQELYMFPDIRDGQNVGVDATDLDPTFGKTLAVVTNKGRRSARRLRLYDVNESAAKRITAVDLDIDTRANRQVTALSFSPDGVLLALGHEDNSVYVYDSRFLPKPGERTQQALCRFVHGDSAVPEEESFGVTCIAWAPSRGPLACGAGEDALYAGGADGHVRLWRTGLSATSCHNGGIVASMCAGIGSFSLGDIFAGEKMLVVGDNNGRLAVWDRPSAPL